LTHVKYKWGTDVQSLKISLPDGTRAALDAASAQSGKSLAEEIRERLAWSFEADVSPGPMRDLLFAVRQLGRLFYIDTGRNWHETLKDRQAMALAIKEIVDSGEPTNPSGTGAPGDPPSVAHILVRHFQRFMEAREETDREIRRLYKERGKSS
jgi:hypothetical protein